MSTKAPPDIKQLQRTIHIIIAVHQNLFAAAYGGVQPSGGGAHSGE
jgi:hypothetical protein